MAALDHPVLNSAFSEPARQFGLHEHGGSDRWAFAVVIDICEARRVLRNTIDGMRAKAA